MNQEEIDELLASSDNSENEEPKKEKEKKGKQQEGQKQENEEIDEEYDDEFEGENVSQKNEDHQQNYSNQQFEDIQEIKEKTENRPIENASQVQSEYASEVIDEIPDQQIQDDVSKKEDDLSLAQSEFIESSKLNKSDTKKGKEKIHINSVNHNKLVNKAKAISKDKANIKKKSQKVNSKRQSVKQPGKTSEKKPKLSEEEIAQKMREIKEQQKQIEKTKKEKDLKQTEKKRKEYEEAMEKEKERKEKNKKILQEQMKNKNKKKEQPHEAKGIKINQEEIELPKKRQSFEYMKMKAGRIQEQKKIKNVIQEDNKRKMKQLKEKSVNPKLKASEKKKQFMEDKNVIKEARMKEKKKEQKQTDTVLVRQIKQEIRDRKRDNQEKKKKIQEFDQTIQNLKKKLKEKQKQMYATSDTKDNEETSISAAYSDLSPIQKFVTYFPEASGPEDIFKIIDQNRDGMLSIAEISQKLYSLGIEEEIGNEVHKVLDSNSDGNVTLEEFSFIIQTEIKRQKDYRQIMGEIDIVDPVQIQAKILDMKAKINYMNKKIEEGEADRENSYQEKYQEYLKKVKKIEAKMNIDKEKSSKEKSYQLFEVNTVYLLSQEAERLEMERKNKSRLLDQIKQSIEKNIRMKNMMLKERVSENLQLQERIYQFKNEFQETQLRFLSMKKIQENKKGYIERQSKQRAQMEEVYRRANQYQIKVADPTKQLKNETYARDVKFLAAVIMIQRNFRKKKALRQIQELKNGKTQSN